MREIIGNYNPGIFTVTESPIIPLREIIGNYNFDNIIILDVFIIPLREIIGNYNLFILNYIRGLNYTLERDNRELQPF